MRALSILQPWAWLIVRPDITDMPARLEAAERGLIKDVENRTWSTSYRGRFLIHAGKAYTLDKHVEYSVAIGEMFGIQLPAFNAMVRGAIVGEAYLADCTRGISTSRWAAPDQWHFALRHQVPLTEPVPYRGQLGLFEISHVIGVVDLLTGDSDRS